MNRNDMDYETSCKACQGSPVPGYSTCPACGDGRHNNDDSLSNGRVNRLSSAKDGKVRLREFVNIFGRVVVEEIPIRDELRGGFEGRYGTWRPTDLTTGPMAEVEQDDGSTGYHDDMVAQLRNDGLGGVSTGPDAGPDLSVDEVIEWLDDRGDSGAADVFRQIRDEKNAAGGGP